MSPADATRVVPVAWDLYLVLSMTIGGGVFGGISSLLAQLQLKDGGFRLDNETLDLKTFLGLLFLNATVGTCGSAAALFVFSSTTWFPAGDTPQDRLWLLTLAVVAGFASRKLLPIVSRRLESQIRELDEKVSRERQDREEQEERAHVRDVVGRALAVLSPASSPTPTELTALKLEVGDVLRRHPLNRVAAIVAARIARRLSDYLDAIRILSMFQEAKEKAGQKDVDYADALYNRACYRCLLWVNTQDNACKALGFNDLRESIALNPPNRQAAREDQDFAAWRSDSEFTQITAP